MDATGPEARLTDLAGMSPAPEAERSAERLLARLELPDAAEELLAMIRFLTAPDGPLQQFAATGLSSPWHERALLKAQERTEFLDRFLRGRVAFFVAGSRQGYGSFHAELELSGAALDTCRAIARVVEQLLAGELPTDHEYELMGDTALTLYPALEKLSNEAPTEVGR